MNKEGYKLLKEFYEWTTKMPAHEKRIISDIADSSGGTFAGAAWAHFKRRRYSPHRQTRSPKTKQTPKSKPISTPKPKTETVVKLKPKILPTKIPYVKEIKPGIKTILFKNVHP